MTLNVRKQYQYSRLTRMVHETKKCEGSSNKVIYRREL